MDIEWFHLIVVIDTLGRHSILDTKTYVEDARVEAEKRSKEYPGRVVYICRAVEWIKLTPPEPPKPKVERGETTEPIPF